VACEPTGWHYSAPVIAVLHHTGCKVLQVEHRVTRHVRELRVSAIKNDGTDALACDTGGLLDTGVRREIPKRVEDNNGRPTAARYDRIQNRDRNDQMWLQACWDAATTFEEK
jgi:hypothetical protein